MLDSATIYEVLYFVQRAQPRRLATEARPISDPTQITPLDNGPLRIVGEITLVDAAGNAIETKAQTFLCRCGQSSNKPFCDGTHNKVGFKNEVRA